MKQQRKGKSESPMKKSMKELVQLAQTGNEEAISQLYEQTYNSIYQSVRAIIKYQDDALDIVQDSYIKGFQNLDKLGNPEKYQAWMKRLASNMALDYLRKKRPALFSERVDEDGEEIDLRHQDDCLDHMPEEVIDRQETTRLMNDILGTLSEEQRLAIVMFYYEERTVREIAESLSCSENTVKSRLNYGRKKIEAEVRALEKRGTKLYSLAPMPFFIWVLRMAKVHGITAEAVARTTAVGVAGGAATAAGETAAASAGSSAAGSVATGAAAKTAGTVAGKTLATKIVAGTLAATMTVGAGAVLYDNTHTSNKEAHIIYEEFLDRYRDAFELDDESFRLDHNRFWDEIEEGFYAKNLQESTQNFTGTHYIQGKPAPAYILEYIQGKTIEGCISVPDTVYTPYLTTKLLDKGITDDEAIKFTYYDIDGDGVDEMFICKFSFGNIQPTYQGGTQKSFDGYSVKDESLIKFRVWIEDGETNTWTITNVTQRHVVEKDNIIIDLDLSRGYIKEKPVPVIEEPILDWHVLYDNK